MKSWLRERAVIRRKERRLRMAELDEQKARAELAAKSHKIALGSFDNSRRTRLRHGSRPRGGSADSHRSAYERDALRKDCQDLLRNNPICRTMVSRLIDLIVGTGPQLQVLTEDEGFNNEVEAYFREWSTRDVDVRRTCDLGQLCAQAVTAACTDGRLLFLKLRDGSLQVIEDERVRNPNHEINSNMLINGVRLDVRGRPFEYHIAEWAESGYNTISSRAVQAAHVLDLNNPLVTAPNVTAAEPALTATLDRFEQVEDHVAATIVAARVATYFAAIIQSDRPAELQGSMLGESVDRGDGDSDRLVDMEPGTFWYARPGETVNQIRPEHPTTSFPDFVWFLVGSIGAELGLAPAVALLDFSKTNFISARAAMSIGYRNHLRWQGWLAKKFLSPIYTWRYLMAVEDGHLPMHEDFGRHEWILPPMPVMHPLEEYKAAALAVQSNLSTHDREVRRLGHGTGDAVIRKRGQERALEAEVGAVAVVPGSAYVPPSNNGDDE